MIDAFFDNIDVDLFDNMATQLDCTVLQCDLGDGGARWKTPALSENNALKYLERHEINAHVQHDGGGRANVGGGAGGKSRLAKIPRPTVSGGCSQEEFNFFISEWERYVRSSPGVDVSELRDQLFSCQDENLRIALQRSHGAQLSTITVADLLGEIKKLAVVRQSNMVNTLALMTAKQERDEPVRQFAARLRGLAAVCDLSVTCACTPPTKVSMVDKLVCMSLIGGLNDEETKQEVLSKVEELPLDETIVFVEARETGKTSLKILSGGLSSSHVNKVHEHVSASDKCKYCGKKGHGKHPSSDLRKDSCPAFGKKCKNCSFLGHFSEQCKKKSRDVPEEHHKSGAKQNHVMIKKMKMKKSLSNKMGILKSTMRQMKKQQNMTKLHHEEWCEKSQTFIKSSLPMEPIMKLRMCLDISSYSNHDPPLECGLMHSWLDDGLSELVRGHRPRLPTDFVRRPVFSRCGKPKFGKDKGKNSMVAIQDYPHFWETTTGSRRSFEEEEQTSSKPLQTLCKRH